MGVPFLLIDGSNLMFAAGFTRTQYGPGDLERCRMQFLKYVIGALTEDERARTTIVFDAHTLPGNVPQETYIGAVTVIFGDDADELIEERLGGHSAPRQLWLVSTDHRLQKAARRRRAKTITSEEFCDELARRYRHRKAPAEEPLPPTPDPKRVGLTEEEAEHWLAEFGEIADADQLQTDLDEWTRLIDEADFDDP